MFKMTYYEVRIGKRAELPSVSNVEGGFRSILNQGMHSYHKITDDEWRKIIFDAPMAKKYLKNLYECDALNGKRERIKLIKPPTAKKWVKAERATPGQALWFMRKCCPSHIIQETF